jgi:prepilin-type processing-associated H-X9-DG protein
VIAVLAAILLPALLSAKRKAKKATCISNLHQLGVALRAFVNDNSAYPSIFGPTNTGNNGYWTIEIEGELSNQPRTIQDFITEGVWRCPSTPRLKPWAKEPFCSYGYNAFGVQPGWTTNLLGLSDLPANLPARQLYGSESLKETTVLAPADMMAIGESIDGMLLFRRWLLAWSKPNKFPNASDRHGGRLNLLLCDGHVDSPTTQFVFEDKTDEALSRWNRDHQPHRELLLR